MIKPKSRGSIYEVAKASGVSIGTVSRVFNEKPDVSAVTRARVLAAAKRVNYMPRISARRINIGLVIEQIEKTHEVGFITDTMFTLAKHMALQGGVLELIPLDDIDAVYRNYVRGIIAIVFGPNQRQLRAIKHVPIVLINNRVEAPNMHSVASDHAQGARLATRYLLARGHKRIAFLEVRHDNWGAQERERGYRQAFKESGVPVVTDLIRYTELRPVKESLTPLLDSRPTGLLVCGEDLSLEVNQILIHDLQIRIPDDLSVISFETPLVSALLSPSQTTVAQPWEEIGHVAVESIISLVHGTAKRNLHVLLPNQLIERASVRSL